MAISKELPPYLKAAIEEAAKCTSCGLCKDVCPVFALTLREAESPRGKVNLLKALIDANIPSRAEGIDIFNRCLLCYACQDACPAGVKTEKIWISARESLAQEVGGSRSKQFFLHHVLPHAGLWKLAFSLGRKLPGSADSVHFSGHDLPRPAGKRIDQLLPETVEPSAEIRGTVAYFPGCLLTEVFPQVGVRIARLLGRLGYRVILPSERVCCGAPAFNNGDFQTATKLAVTNLKLFADLDIDAIISPDATCGGAFHHEYELLFPPGSQHRKLYLEIREKVQEFSEFMDSAVARSDDLTFGTVKQRVILHDSCHLSHTQHKADIPKRLLGLIPGLEIFTSPRAEICCGFGGSYSVFFPGESKAIARRKLEYLRSTGEHLFAVESPGCLWRLRSEAAELHMNVRIHHYLEILCDSLLGGPEPYPEKSGEKEA